MPSSGLLLEVALERLAAGQGELDLGDLPVPVAQTTDVAHWTAPKQLAVPVSAGGRPELVAGGGKVVGTASLLWWVLAEVGVDPPGLRTVFRCLDRWVKDWEQALKYRYRDALAGASTLPAATSAASFNSSRAEPIRATIRPPTAPNPNRV